MIDLDKTNENLLSAEYFWRVVRVIGVNFESKKKRAALVKPFVWRDFKREIKDIIGIRKVHGHTEGEQVHTLKGVFRCRPDPFEDEFQLQ